MGSKATKNPVDPNKPRAYSVMWNRIPDTDKLTDREKAALDEVQDKLGLGDEWRTVRELAQEVSRRRAAAEMEEDDDFGPDEEQTQKRLDQFLTHTGQLVEKKFPWVRTKVIRWHNDCRLATYGLEPRQRKSEPEEDDYSDYDEDTDGNYY